MHAAIASTFAILCFVYADGTPNTTWFHCNYYKLHMFPIQKYLTCFSASFYLFDLLFSLLIQSESNSHLTCNFLTIIWLLIANRIGGFIGQVA